MEAAHQGKRDRAARAQRGQRQRRPRRGSQPRGRALAAITHPLDISYPQRFAFPPSWCARSAALGHGVVHGARQGGKGAKKAAPAPPKEVDPDPEGAALAAVADPLEQAARLARLLKEHAGGHVRTHVLAYEVRAGSLRMGVLVSAAHALQHWGLFTLAQHVSPHSLVCAGPEGGGVGHLSPLTTAKLCVTGRTWRASCCC